MARLKAVDPSLRETYHDLAAQPIRHLSGAYLAGQSPDVQHDQALQEDLAHGGRVREEFLAAIVAEASRSGPSSGKLPSRRR